MHIPPTQGSLSPFEAYRLGSSSSVCEILTRANGFEELPIVVVPSPVSPSSGHAGLQSSTPSAPQSPEVAARPQGRAASYPSLPPGLYVDTAETQKARVWELLPQGRKPTVWSAL